MEQVIFGGFYNALNVAVTEYNIISSGKVWTAFPNEMGAVVSSPGILKNLRVELDGVPGTGTYTFTLYRRVGLGAWALTALTCTVAADGTIASDTANSVSVAAGDVICLECNPDAPDNARYARWTMMFEGDNANESLILTAGFGHKSIAMYFPPGADGAITTEFNVRRVCPTSGVIKNLYIQLENDPGAAPDAYKFTLRIANAGNSYVLTDTALTVTITANDRIGNNTANDITVAAGDILTIKAEPLNAPSTNTNVAIGMIFVADIDGESLLLGGLHNDLPTTDTEYIELATETVAIWSATEAQRYSLGQGCTLKKLYMFLNGSPGAGKKYVFTVRLEGASPGGGLVVEIADAATTGNDTANEIAVSDGETVGMEVNPDGTPTARDAYWGLVVDTTPPPVGWAGGDVLGVDIATIAKINGVLLADIVKVNGIA